MLRYEDAPDPEPGPEGGIGSGVSTATLAIAKALGARVIATSSSGAKLARARGLGADATFDHNADDVVAGVPRRPYRAAYPERVYCFF